MSHQCSFLSEKWLPELYQTFVEAFSDYVLDMSHLTEEKFLNRMRKNGIDLESSVGAFDQDKMIGFTMVGLDNVNGIRSAFDIGTGITKAYRGKGIAAEMFEYALPRLRRKNVKKFILEVIRTNERAIKAYQRAGFRITRELDCLELKLENARLPGEIPGNTEIRPVNRDELLRFSDFLDWEPSWENSFASIRRIPDGVLLFCALHDDEDVGLIVYYPALDWIMSLAVSRPFRRRGVATGLMQYLFNQLGNTVSSVKILNVLRSDEAMLALLGKIGFELFTTQFEMSLDLT
ncbi:MAG: hypothetical protein AMJ46_12045 [Latescibacteria bacterium DG_63]|nr:MAG: hypothetical protein AMJ46_12045 [Latescibacteria bacterium DG_63]